MDILVNRKADYSLDDSVQVVLNMLKSYKIINVQVI